MKVDIYDTYARSAEGLIIHFDVLVESGTPHDKAYQFAKEWLTEIGENPEKLDQSRCNYCHSGEANPEIKESIGKKEYYILQMEGCPNPIH